MPSRRPGPEARSGTAREGTGRDTAIPRRGRPTPWAAKREACGTPVLAFRHGSVPEIVEDGVTGRIVDTVEEAVAVLPDVVAMDRRRVRRRFEARFTAERMARDYVELYTRQAAPAGPRGMPVAVGAPAPARSARTGSEGRGHPEPAPGGAVPAAARGSSQG